MGFMETKFCEACDEDYDWAAPECPGCVRRRYDEAQAKQVAALKTELAKYKQLAEAARLIAEVDRLRDLLREALDLADEAIGYTPEYFQDKWELPQTAARLRRALGEEVE
jgi:predicted RNase H-like HicB family nuclease